MAVSAQGVGPEPLDWRLLRVSPITLYFRAEVLAEDTAWLEQHGYHVYRLDCAGWQTEDDFHADVKGHLGFPDYYGLNLNALNDCLAELSVSEESSIVLVFLHFDQFAELFSETAWTILDIIAGNSWFHLLRGRRLMALVQSDDPTFQVRPVGARPVRWNSREWLNKDRGL